MRRPRGARRFDLGFGRVFAAVRDVVGNRPRKKVRLLGDDAEVLVVLDLVVLVDGNAVDTHLAAGGVVETRDELDGRRLPGAGLADERDGLTRVDVQINAAQCIVDGRGVAEHDVLEVDLAPQLRHRNRVGGRRDRGGRVEQLGDPADRHLGLLVRVEHLRELLDRREEQVQVQQERDQAADRHRAVRDQHARRPEHDAHRDVGEEVDEREVDRNEPLRMHSGVTVTRSDLGEVLLVLVFADERLRDANAGEPFLQIRVDGRDAFAGLLVGLRRRVAEPNGRDDERRQDGRRHERELRVHERQQDADADKRDDVDHRVDEAVLQQLRQRVDVGGHAGHDAARHLVLVVVDTEPLEVREHLDAKGMQ